MHRREFLSLLAAASMGRTAIASPPRAWHLAVEPGLFECDAMQSVTHQIAFAAAQGFRAFVDDAWLWRCERERRDVLDATRALGLRWGPLRGPALRGRNRQEWQRELQAATTVAAHVASPAVRMEVETTAVAAALLRSPRVLVEWSSSQSTAVLAAFPDLRFSVDIYRLAAQGVDVVAFLERHLPRIGHIELADFPGGLEPGTGRLAIYRICRLLDEHGYTGVVGLRHGRSRPGWPGIEAVLQACHQIEPSIASSREPTVWL